MHINNITVNVPVSYFSSVVPMTDVKKSPQKQNIKNKIKERLWMNIDITMGYKNIERTDQIDGRETIDGNDLAVYDVSLRDIQTGIFSWNENNLNTIRCGQLWYYSISTTHQFTAVIYTATSPSALLSAGKPINMCVLVWETQIQPLSFLMKNWASVREFKHRCV